MRRFLSLPYLPPALLVLVAVTQFTLAQTTALSAWKLGGFGMFSTSNSTASRVLRVTLATDDGVYMVPGPVGSLGVRTWPRPAALRESAREAACGRWRLVPLDSLETVVFPGPEWDLLYRVPQVLEQTEIVGFAVPDDASGIAPGAGVRAAHASVLWVRLGTETGRSALRAVPIAAESVTPAEAGCPPRR